MMIDIKKRELFRRHQDLFDFAQAYLSKDFPNPDRAGCPQDHALRLLARSPGPGDASIADHVTCCSPCFNAYTAHLERARAELKSSRATTRAAWIRPPVVWASLVLGLLIVVYAVRMKTQNQPSTAQNLRAAITQSAGSPPGAVAASQRVLLDLTTAAPERGLQPPSPPAVPSIPAKPRIDLTLRLPIGSEVGMYSVKLASQRGTEWSSAARASIADGEPVLNLRGDFSHLPGGIYQLVVVSAGERLRQPVRITPPAGEQR